MQGPDIFKTGLLNGKTALVTGGASGIGRGIAACLARAGADVIIASRRQELCEAYAREMAETYGVRTLGIGLDVRKSEAINTAFDEAVAKMGRLDVLVNNAAGNFYFPAEQLSDNQWRAVLEIDLYGTFYCSRAAFKHLHEHGGTIVSISMTLHHTGWAGMAPACAAKSGIDAITRTLALEWGRFGIRVNAIAPGPIITEGVKKAFALGGDFEQHKDSVPLGRAGEPEEIGNMVVFMASEAGAWMTGSIVTIDGGESLSPRRAGVAPEALEQLAALMKAQR
ncbi:MAG: SDR family oxidoreductase [Candidatus Hydrogenedentes bacterium]|nr:SDR family oxidoreductase [Candidatus Hydrogenedentota bacterium]